MMNLRLTRVIALSAAVAAVGCTVQGEPNYMIAPQINHMLFSKAQESQGRMFSPRYNPTQTDPNTVEDGTFEVAGNGGLTLMTPPKGTIPRGFKPTHYPVDLATAKKLGKVDDKGKPDLVAVANAQAIKAGKELSNPVTADEASLKRGKEVFNTFCAPCHGKSGRGDGPVAARGVGMPGYPLSLPGAGPSRYEDGHIFHIITYGRGNMGSYASQIAPEDRWKAILWLRELIKKGGAI